MFVPYIGPVLCWLLIFGANVENYSVMSTSIEIEPTQPAPCVACSQTCSSAVAGPNCTPPLSCCLVVSREVRARAHDRASEPRFDLSAGHGDTTSSCSTRRRCAHHRGQVRPGNRPAHSKVRPGDWKAELVTRRELSRRAQSWLCLGVAEQMRRASGWSASSQGDGTGDGT